MNTENKLPEDFKKKFLEALRSGKYEQCKISLTRNGAYCVAGIAGICLGLPMGTNDEKGKVYNAIQKMIGRQRMWNLIDMNDAGKAFPELANYIEQNL